MSITYRSRSNPDRLVEAALYLPDGSNSVYVRNFLELSCTSPWSGPHTQMGGGNYKTICYHYKSGHTLYVKPDTVVYVEKDGEPHVITEDAFHEYFSEVPEVPDLETKEPEPMPVVMPAPETYIRTDDRTASSHVIAIQYHGTANGAAVKSLLRQYGSVEFVNQTNGEITYQPNPGYTDVLNAPSGVTVDPIIIPTNTWVTFTLIKSYSVPLFGLYAPGDFTKSFAKISTITTPAPKKTPKPVEFTFNFNPGTEYGQKVTEILDVLAILRTDPSNAHIELVTKELMVYLANAFNEGWEEGLAAAQTNPYEDWDKS